MIGALRKLQRFFAKQGERSLIVSLDHGASDGMLPGIARLPEVITTLKQIPVQGVVLNKGLARAMAAHVEPETNLVIQLSAGTKHGLPTYNKSIVCSVAEALRLGADGVAMHVNIGNDLEDRMLADLGDVTEEAHQLGVPVLAVIYARGGQIVDELDPSLIAHSIRIGCELGADIVSVPYSGERGSFAQAVDACTVPVLVAGGPAVSQFDAFLNQIGEAMECGASGALVGRNVFQHAAPAQALKLLSERIHGSGREE